MKTTRHDTDAPELPSAPMLVARTLLEGWYRHSRLGARLRSQVAADMRLILDEWFGYHMLVVGADADIPVTDMTRVQHVTRIVPTLEPKGQVGRNLVALDHELPVATESVDVVVLVNALELSEMPHQLLREVHRVLTPHGHLLVVGSNKFSLRGLWHGALRLFRGAERIPKWGPSASQLEDWLTLLDFAVAPVRHKLVLPFSSRGRFGSWLQRVDSALVEHNIPLGSAYVVYGNKMVRGHIQPRTLERSRARLMGLPVVRPVAGARESLRRDAHVRPGDDRRSIDHLRPVD